MGRNKKQSAEKAVKKSITLKPETYHELEVKSGRNKISRIINDDLTWYWNILDTVGFSMTNRFQVEEIIALCNIFEEIRVEPGQVGLLQQKLSLLFQVDKNTPFSREQKRGLEKEYKISIFKLRHKLNTLTPIEAVWLHEKLLQVHQEPKEKIDEHYLSFVFRCGGDAL